MEFGKKNEDEEYPIPYLHTDRSATVQETRIFSNSRIDVRQAIFVITKLLYSLGQNQHLSSVESTDAFFNITKLFQNPDESLRRMMYLVLKELAPFTENAFVIVNSLLKDMGSPVDVYRGNAIRVLCRITDSSMLASIDRHIKEALVDNSPAVQSSALLSALVIAGKAPDVVRRWSSEIQSCLLGASQPMVQYHALLVLHKIKKHDKKSLAKLVFDCGKSLGFRSVPANVLLIRIARSILSGSAEKDGELTALFHAAVKHKNVALVIEGANALCSQPMSEEDASTLTKNLMTAMTSTRSGRGSIVGRYSIVQCLNSLAGRYPDQVAVANSQLETLMKDSNRSVATLAVATLLKTGRPDSMEGLLRKVSGMISDIPDEFRLSIAESIRSLCMQYPEKHAIFVHFLSNCLREEGTLTFKRAIVDSFFLVIQRIQGARELVLTHLCEFIEDCEFSVLAQRVINLLGKEIPKTPHPSRYIRFIYNRVVLELPPVRAAAILALARIACACHPLRPSIETLLLSALNDSDDEVRDRAAVCLYYLHQDEKTMHTFLMEEFAVPVGILEQSLREYSVDSSTAFDLERAQKLAQVAAEREALHAEEMAAAAAASSGASEVTSDPVKNEARDSHLQELLSKVPELRDLGLPLFSSRAAVVTEEEAEYSISVIKHFYQSHLVLQYNVTNTLREMQLEDVLVEITELDVEGLEFAFVVPAPLAVFNQEVQCFVVFTLHGDQPEGTLSNVLKFSYKEVDPDTGDVDEDGFESQYWFDAVDIGFSDLMCPARPPVFGEAWDRLAENNASETMKLNQMKTIKDAVPTFLKLLGMYPQEGSRNVNPDAAEHELLLAGRFRGEVLVLVQAHFFYDKSGAVCLELHVRGETRNVVEHVLRSVV